MQKETTVNKDERVLQMRKGMIKDDRERMLLVLFKADVEDVHKDNYYEFKKMRVQKHMDEKLTKSTETSTGLKSQNTGLDVTEDETAEPDQTQTDAKIVLVDMKTLIPMYFCQLFNSQVEIENATVGCNNSENEALKSPCK